jgi:predicted Zn finger-like uncharacterized protein
MILTCPECSTRYSVEPSSLGEAGRTVRCANCGNRWTALPPDDAPQAVELGPAMPPPRHRAARPEAAQARRTPTLVAWLLAALAVLLIAGSIIARDEIVASFPASAAIFQRVGLPVAVPLNLEFENVTSSRVSERGISILTVEGEIVNLASQSRTVPQVRITLLDQGGRQLHHELIEADPPVLEPGARAAFTGRVVNPAEQAQNFSVTFDLE